MTCAVSRKFFEVLNIYSRARAQDFCERERESIDGDLINFYFGGRGGLNLSFTKHTTYQLKI